MTNNKIIGLLIFFASLSFLLLETGCSNRSEIPEMNGDSTIIFRAKDSADMIADILLFRKKDKKSGALIGEGRVFTLMENENLRAVVDFDRPLSEKYPKWLFHFDWIDPDGKSIYQKHIEIISGDPLSKLKSSISLSPMNRRPGIYTVRLYYFRERISEKQFELVPKFLPGILAEIAQSGRLDVSCFRSVQKSGDPENDSVFIIAHKSNIKAKYKILNRKVFGRRELQFRYEWVGPDGKTFYAKTINLQVADTSSGLASSISISPKKREPGKYALRLYLFHVLIAEKNMTLISESQAMESLISGIHPAIKLYRNKKKGKYSLESQAFYSGAKRHVYAEVHLNNTQAKGDKELRYSLRWVDPDGRTVFEKPFAVKSNQKHYRMNSSISITPGKRKPGTYHLQLYLFNQLISQKQFEIKEE